MEAYYGITVSLADTNAHKLLDLLVLADASLAGLLQNVGRVSIQADSANADVVYVGDKQVSSTRMGRKLAATSPTVELSKEAMSIPLGAIYVRAASATQKLNVEVIP